MMPYSNRKRQLAYYKKYNKKWYKLNRIQRLEACKIYRKQNSEKLQIYRDSKKQEKQLYNKKYLISHRKEILNHQNKKRKINLNFKIKSNLQSRLYSALIGTIKSKRTLELLGCSVDFLKQHLESLFTEDMNWNNYGRKYNTRCWEIDHIEPCVSFNLANPEDQKKCFHYTNLQPLWASDNRSKTIIRRKNVK
jgi:hypothetical protein